MAHNVLSTAVVGAGLRRAVRSLSALQEASGRWSGINRAGALETGLYLVFAQLAGRLTDRDRAGACAFLRRVQRSDGGFPAYPQAAESDLAASAAAWAGLHAAGVGRDDHSYNEARAYVLRHQHHLDVVGNMHLALAGLPPVRALPRTTLLFRLLPGIDRLLGCRFGFGFVLAATEVPAVRLLQHPEAPRPWDRLAARSAERYIRQRQNPNGDWAGLLVTTLWGCLALQALGVPRGDAALEAGWRSLDRLKLWDGEALQLAPHLAEVWNTALITRLLLWASADEPALLGPVERGLRYLLRQQARVPAPPDWQRPRLGAPRHGGWPYGEDNALCTDCDTTGAVLWTLGEATRRRRSVPPKALRRGLRWLWGMQNPDHGWAAFARGLGRKPAGPILTQPLAFPSPEPTELLRLLLDPPLGLVDPATAGLTGRVLSALGACGYRSNHPRVGRAIAFLEHQQSVAGPWWGRWEVNFVPGTACVLSGLAAVGANLRAPWIRRAVEWLLRVQGADGGWGEGPDSYRDPSLAGAGPSHPRITGAALTALIDLGLGDHPAVTQGVRYLLDTQDSDGLWPGDDALFVTIPPHTFYNNPIYAQYAPAEALLRYQQHLAGEERS